MPYHIVSGVPCHASAYLPEPRYAKAYVVCDMCHVVRYVYGGRADVRLSGTGSCPGSRPDHVCSTPARIAEYMKFFLDDDAIYLHGKLAMMPDCPRAQSPTPNLIYPQHTLHRALSLQNMAVLSTMALLGPGRCTISRLGTLSEATACQALIEPYPWSVRMSGVSARACILAARTP